MRGHIEEIVFFGDDVRIGRFPAHTRFVYANEALAALPDFDAELRAALDRPLGAEPLEKQLGPKSRVTIAFDDPCLPVPLMLRDPRAKVVGEVLKRLFTIGIPKERIRIVCANGLHRKWSLDELKTVLGRKVVSLMAERISCHDATLDDELSFLGTTSRGHEVEVNRACVEADMLIYVNLNFTSMNGGAKSVLVGLGSWRSIRHHHGPAQWNTDASIMDPATCPMHAILAEMYPLVQKSCNVFQIETVTNNNVWPFPLDLLLAPLGSGHGRKPAGALRRTLFEAASLAPEAFKGWVRKRLVRSDYRPVAVNAGAPAPVHARTLDVLFRQQNVAVESQADVVIYGVPSLSPYSSLSDFNPILLRSLVMGYLVGLFRGRPLVKKGGVVIACNPGFEQFNERHHPAYIDFWKNHLPEYEDPVRCWEELSEPYAANERYLACYREDLAYHGAHGLINWMWSGMGLKHVSSVILAGAREPLTARKIGFIPEPDLGRAIDRALETAGRDASITYQVIPPLFCVDVA